MKPEGNLDAWLAEANRDLVEATTDELDIEETLIAVKKRAAMEVVSQHLLPDVVVDLVEGRLSPIAQEVASLHADECKPCATAIADAGLAHRPRAGSMVHDEDTGRQVVFSIRGEERVPTHTRRERLPSPKMQREIIGLAQHRGWSAERIFHHLRQEYNRHDISLKAVRRVLARPRIREERFRRR